MRVVLFLCVNDMDLEYRLAVRGSVRAWVLHKVLTKMHKPGSSSVCRGPDWERLFWSKFCTKKLENRLVAVDMAQHCPGALVRCP